ncbi:hypothetical protein EDB83DRAFT_2319573 [Lactarius deliciosus]|nr:hypothetical protein EDB83DRAFT_2319573 [Lactarius deliciosus]
MYTLAPHQFLICCVPATLDISPQPSCHLHNGSSLVLGVPLLPFPLCCHHLPHCHCHVTAIVTLAAIVPAAASQPSSPSTSPPPNITLHVTIIAVGITCHVGMALWWFLRAKRGGGDGGLAHGNGLEAVAMGLCCEVEVMTRTCES